MRSKNKPRSRFRPSQAVLTAVNADWALPTQHLNLPLSVSIHFPNTSDLTQSPPPPPETHPPRPWPAAATTSAAGDRRRSTSAALSLAPPCTAPPPEPRTALPSTARPCSHALASSPPLRSRCLGSSKTERRRCSGARRRSPSSLPSRGGSGAARSDADTMVGRHCSGAEAEAQRPVAQFELPEHEQAHVPESRAAAP